MTSNPAPHPPTSGQSNTTLPRDSQTRGFLLALWVTALLTLFGLEARALIYGDYAPIMLGILALFCAIVFLIRHLLVRRLRYGLKPAHSQVAVAVQARARELGVSREVIVLRTKSWSHLNGYTFEDRKRSYVVVTSGTQALLLVEPGEEKTRTFFALVDHELGHVVNRDASLLYLAQALLWANLVGVGLKVVAISLIATLLPPTAIATIYEGLVPQSSDIVQVGFSGSLDRRSAPSYSQSTIQTVVIGYTLAMLLLFALFYVIVVRRREFWADSFAVLHAPAPLLALDALTSLLRKNSGRGVQPHSFFGRMLFHPAPAHRVLNLEAGVDVFGSHTGISVFLILCMLISFRFTLGNSGLLRDFEAPRVPLMVMSGFFVFLCGYCIACLVHPEDRGARRWWVGSYWAFKRLVIFSAATAATLWAVHRLSSAWHNRFDWSEQERMVGAAYRALLDVESNEVGWMFFSIPVVTATFAASYLVIVALASLIGRCRRVNLMSAAVASLLAVAVLWGLGKVCEPVVQNSREANLVRFQGSARMGTWLNPNDIREDPTRIQGQRLQRSDLALEGFVAFARFTGSDYAFHPPFSAVLLWQGPYRAGY